MTRRSKLKSWIEGKLGKSRKDSAIPEPPMLPEPRHILTPSSSKDDLFLPNQTAPIFTRLPPEIRNEILLQAFGGRTVHIDLVYQHPPDPSRPRQNPSGHYGEMFNSDRSKPKSWQWRGCVCHRNPSNICRMYEQKHAGILDPSGGPTGDIWPPLYPQDPSSGLGEDMYRAWQLDEPGEDSCCRGYGLRCSDHTSPEIGGTPDSCWIGAMGWLLACRRSYTEGIKVLYRTNTIHISSKPLLTNLPRLILPQRLQTMNALEIVWVPDRYLPRGGQERRGDYKTRHEQMPQIHDIILRTFPHVRRLHLAFNINWPLDRDPNLDDTIHQWDAFATALASRGNLQAPLTVSLTSSSWKRIYEKVKQVATNKDSCSEVVDSQFWRWTNGECALAPRTKSTETWVKVDGASKENGYWIIQGDKDDLRVRLYTCECF